MKVFTVFLALVILNTSVMVYHDDLRHYEKLKNDLSTEAENCADGASMYYDYDAYGEGRLEFDAGQIEILSDQVREACMEKDLRHLIKDLKITVYTRSSSGSENVYSDGREDTLKQEYRQVLDDSADKADGQAEVAVFIHADLNDPFRQPFLRADHLDVFSIYGSSPL